MTSLCFQQCGCQFGGYKSIGQSVFRACGHTATAAYQNLCAFADQLGKLYCLAAQGILDLSACADARKRGGQRGQPTIPLPVTHLRFVEKIAARMPCAEIKMHWPPSVIGAHGPCQRPYPGSRADQEHRFAPAIGPETGVEADKALHSVADGKMQKLIQAQPSGQIPVAIGGPRWPSATTFPSLFCPAICVTSSAKAQNSGELPGDECQHGKRHVRRVWQGRPPIKQTLGQRRCSALAVCHSRHDHPLGAAILVRRKLRHRCSANLVPCLHQCGVQCCRKLPSAADQQDRIGHVGCDIAPDPGPRTVAAPRQSRPSKARPAPSAPGSLPAKPCPARCAADRLFQSSVARCLHPPRPAPLR